MGIAMGKTMVTGSGGRDAACKQFRDVWMLARIVDEDNRVGLQGGRKCSRPQIRSF